MNVTSLAFRSSTAGIIAVACSLNIAAVNAFAANLIPNPGFEAGSGSTPISWLLSEGAQGNTFQWVQGEPGGADVHSGSRSLRMNAVRAADPEQSMNATSALFAVPALSRVEASVWIKADSVVSQGDADWYGLRVTLSVYDSAGNVVSHTDLIDEVGTIAWRKVQGGMIVPEQARTMSLSVKLTTSTGVVWIDDAEARVAESLPAVDVTGVRAPVVLPHPWQARFDGSTSRLGYVGIVDQSGDERIRNALDSLLQDAGVARAFVAENDLATDSFSTQIVLGDSTNAILAQALKSKFPSHDWPDLGGQGYLLAVDADSGQNRICIGANSAVGAFYAIATLRQLFVGDSIYVGDVLDAPTVSRRGIAVGLHWFEEPTGEAVKRLADLKGNFVWAQGSFLDDCLDTDNWRHDLTASQKTILQGFIESCHEKFIEVWLAIGPRGKNPPVQYSSDEDIDTVVRKMDTLYSLGLRHFGLRFDDLVNVEEDRLLVQEDIDAFNNDIGDAQAYFISEVYTRLSGLHPDIEFMVVPMDYAQVGNYDGKSAASMRLRQFRELPAQIGVYSASDYDEDILSTSCLTGRPVITLASNLYAEGDFTAPVYMIPYVSFIDWQNTSVRGRIAGFTWGPRTPQTEDASLVSWRTAADFAWAPERYDPETSFQLAVAQYLGMSENGPTAP